MAKSVSVALFIIVPNYEATKPCYIIIFAENKTISKLTSSD